MIKKKIEKECLKNPHEESCGIIFFAKRRTRVFPCFNWAEDRESRFVISNADFVKCSKMGKVFGIYHSHVKEDAEFSERDLMCSEETNFPYFVYSIKTKKHAAYIPKSLIEKNTSFKNFLLKVKKDFSVKDIKG